MPKHLMRTWYRTDADPGATGSISASIPDSAFEDSEIVNVEWQPGMVEVTFLMEGRGYDA